VRVGTTGARTIVRLAEEFGFCYGVDRAVDYAYQTRQRFPDRTVYITGEIIHNPGVNERLRGMGIRFLDGSAGGSWRIEDLGPGDVVILPAFGVPVATMKLLESAGCTMVDATCGSVLNVWKNVERYARDGFTSIIHGKYAHEETAATASRATACGGHYLVVRDMEQARRVCREIEGPSDPEEFLSRFAPAVSAGFDPRLHLERVGLANQTTMLSSESMEVGRLLGEAIARRDGPSTAVERFRSFDTICSATQDRQDGIRGLLGRGVDLMLVIGGYNSSNTNALKRITAESVPTFHLEVASGLLDERRIRHLPVGQTEEIVTEGWLPASGDLTVGVTAGASTPNSEVGLVIERVLRLRGASSEDIEGL
jgi:4-hydroxy-3-methylbut-2-enyl diphosphate reductase